MSRATQKYIQKFRFKSIYFKLYIACICLVMIPAVLICAFIYHKVSINFQNEITQYNLNELHHMESEINTVLNEINTTLYQYAVNPDVLYFNANTFNTNMLLLKDIYNDLNSDLVKNSYIDSIYIYYIATDQLLTSGGISSMEDFYDREWYNLSQKNTASANLLSTRKVTWEHLSVHNEKEIATMVRYFPIAGASPSGAIAININIGALQRKITQIGRQEDRAIFIIDSTGLVVSSSESGLMYQNLYEIIDMNLSDFSSSGYILGEHNGRKMISYTSASSYGWRFVQMTPIEQVTRNLMFINNMFVVVFGVALLIGVFLVYFVVNRMYSPVVTLMDTLYKGRIVDFDTVSGQYKNEIEVLQGGLLGVFHNLKTEQEKNHVLHHQVDQTSSVLTTKYFHDLIMGSSVNSDNAVEWLKAFDWPEKSYVVLIIIMDDYEKYRVKWDKVDLALWKFSLLNVSEEIMGDQYKSIVFESIPNEFIAVIHIHDESKEQSQQKISAIADTLRETVRQLIKEFTVSISIGSVSENLYGLSESYTNALNALQLRWLRGKDITVLSSEKETNTRNMFYNLKKEQLIISALKANELDKAIILFEQFLTELVEMNHQIYENINQGILQLIVSILKMLHGMGYSYGEVFKSQDNILQEMGKIETLNEVSNWVKIKFNAISLFFSESRGRKQNVNIQSIIKYIDENYQKDIYLEEIARSFGMNSSYLSRIFKAETGDNFLDYLNNARIEKAKLLLETTESNIGDICKEVGYVNIQTFIRVFKKWEGITPSVYRNDKKNTR